MKTLILNGSPRVHGDTVSLINQLTKSLDGEYRIVDAYRSNISPCLDCRYCWENSGCAIKDEMQEIYSYIEDWDDVDIIFRFNAMIVNEFRLGSIPCLRVSLQKMNTLKRQWGFSCVEKGSTL